MKRRTFTTLLAAGTTARAGAASPKPSLAPYKIGVTYPLTGPLASVSAEFFPGYEQAIDEINRAGGVKGHPLQLVVEDTQASPQAGLAAMRKLVQVDGVQAIASIFTNVVTAQIPLADEVKVPVLSPIEADGIVSEKPVQLRVLCPLRAIWPAPAGVLEGQPREAPLRLLLEQRVWPGFCTTNSYDCPRCKRRVLRVVHRFGTTRSARRHRSSKKKSFNPTPS